jgi:anthranilate synthase component I
LKAPFDIAGDLDTPVSAYAKLASFGPHFLLESVEGGERLARYSFIGFGEGLEVRLDADGLSIGAERLPVPASQAELLAQLRRALALAPRPQPEIPGVPLAGGLVGFTAYDVVRFFERLPQRHERRRDAPILHYVAPRSLLVFDHLTRSIALLHAGPEAERQSLRREVIAALRGPVPGLAGTGTFVPPAASLSRESTWPACAVRRSTSRPATSTSWCCRRASAAGIRSIRSRPTARCG